MIVCQKIGILKDNLTTIIYWRTDGGLGVREYFRQKTAEQADREAVAAEREGEEGFAEFQYFLQNRPVIVEKKEASLYNYLQCTKSEREHVGKELVKTRKKYNDFSEKLANQVRCGIETKDSFVEYGKKIKQRRDYLQRRYNRLTEKLYSLENQYNQVNSDLAQIQGRNSTITKRK